VQQFCINFGNKSKVLKRDAVNLWCGGATCFGCGVFTRCCCAYMPSTVAVASSTEEICTHVSSTDCFQRVTLWSPVDTASTLPVTDHDTRHTGASKVRMRVGTHLPSLSTCFHTCTVLSSEQLAIRLYGMPVFGAQATSLTQSENNASAS
jgi:hypothetical protein